MNYIYTREKREKNFDIQDLDCNQIKIFINLEIIGEKKLYIFLKSKNLEKILQFGEATWHNYGI